MTPTADSLAPLPPGPFSTILADPPWRFMNRTGKVAPEHRRLSRYDTMTAKEIAHLPVADTAASRSHLYLWVPNALLADGLMVMEEWGFTYKANLVWHKVRKDGGSDGRGVGFYFRNVTELILFGVRGSLRTLPPGRRQVNLFSTRKREHSRKPDELYPIIEACSPGPYLELFARYPRPGWSVWGNESAPTITPRGRQHRGYGTATVDKLALTEHAFATTVQPISTPGAVVVGKEVNTMATGKKDASRAGRLLGNPKTPPRTKSVAASDLAQAKKPKKK